VVVLERSPDPDYLCNSRLTGGAFHVCLSDIQSDGHELEAKINTATAGATHPELARAIAADARRAVRWLQHHGVRFIKGGSEPHHNFVLSPPSLQRVGADWRGRGGDVLLRTLGALLKKSGGELLRGHRALELFVADARCTGVKGQMETGSFEVLARCTVIADGGFQCDPDLLRESISPMPDRVLQRNARSGLGDGLRMARAVGAKLSSMVGFYGHVMHRDAMTNDRLWPLPWMDNIATSAVVVAQDGKRFADEGRGGVFLANKIAALDDPLSATVIFDQQHWDGVGKSRFFPPNPHMERLGGRIVRAPTVEGLEKVMDLPVSTLVETVSLYNNAVNAGAVELLSPPRSAGTYKPTPISTAPFYGIPVCAGVTYTMGGLAIDEWSRALKQDGTPFEGLYAVGGSSGGLEGGESVGYVGGLAKAATTGLRAGEHILRTLGATAEFARASNPR
jgi:fumarate reductase flavoprotein subunit